MATPDLGTSAVTAFVEDATAAPSLHNAQPWKFRFLRDSSTLRLYADFERELPETDPEGRALHLGCGAALLNLRVAAVAAGREPATRLLPDDSDAELLAEVDLTGTARPDESLAGLHPAIHRRHTSRYPFREDDLPAALRNVLCDAARREGARLVFPDASHVLLVLDLVHEVELGEALVLGLGDEVTYRPRTEPARQTIASDGTAVEALGPGQWGANYPVHDVAAARTGSGHGWAPTEDRPHIALLGTIQDRPVDWLRAGQALERVLLQATRDGLVASLAFQPFEWPELRWAVPDPMSLMGYVQMVIHLGYGPEGQPTPRRRVTDVLDIV
ncbi:hypothetical protein [Streptomyces sp. TP-A0356]|uniref:Acg family FMN-binding oxidoreductase n=1 Tax=Streptomyces sp. TP-A0356 TaxID=1359208 RepID=UPI0006E23BEF|nr:hypothetical protein [Streptomyces sp. TP-A0356]